MLAVSRAVLMKVHSGVFAALASPPVTGPDGEPVYSNWDVRHVLSCERKKVCYTCSPKTCIEKGMSRVVREDAQSGR